MVQSLTVAVLLGAGASADAEIPTTMKMTQEVIDRMTNARHVRILEFVRHTLAADLAQRQPPNRWERSEDVHIGVDVERLFASVELLVDRNEQPWSPFVATWHPGLESFSSASSVNEHDMSFQLNNFESALKSALSEASRASGSSSRIDTRSIRKALAEVVAGGIQHARQNDVSKLLAQVRHEMLSSLFDVLNIDDPSKVGYLNPLIELARSQGSLTIATLNYDRSIENVAELAQLPCDTGIETWLERGNFEWPKEEGLRLLKLHGSIDWVVHGGSGARGELPLQHFKKVESDDEKLNYQQPAVVFGENGKLRSEGPYLELLLAWSRELERASSLLVVGYSFRDPHVNELVARWFNASPTHQIILVDPSDCQSADARSFAWYLAHVDDSIPIPDQRPRPAPRFRQFIGRTRDCLEQGIAAASTVLPVDAVD